LPKVPSYDIDSGFLSLISKGGLLLDLTWVLAFSTAIDWRCQTRVPSAIMPNKFQQNRDFTERSHANFDDEFHLLRKIPVSFDEDFSKTAARINDSIAIEHWRSYNLGIT
jgi:hypothetical protein